jgi:hypothetical protein
MATKVIEMRFTVEVDEAIADAVVDDMMADTVDFIVKQQNVLTVTNDEWEEM